MSREYDGMQHFGMYLKADVVSGKMQECGSE